jgi:hypothetical protein
LAVIGARPLRRRFEPPTTVPVRRPSQSLRARRRRPSTTICRAQRKDLARSDLDRAKPPSVRAIEGRGCLSPAISLAEGDHRDRAPAEWRHAPLTMRLAGTNPWRSDQSSHGLVKPAATNEADGMPRAGGGQELASGSCRPTNPTPVGPAAQEIVPLGLRSSIWPESRPTKGSRPEARWR